MIDCSVVRQDVSRQELTEFIDLVKKYRFIGAHPMPCYVPEVVSALEDYPEVLVGGVVSFPFGATTTPLKVLETEECIEAGCREIDMVMNIGRMLSGDEDYVEKDIRAVVQAAGKIPVKVIMEIHFLSLEQIRKAARLCVRAGARFVKTSTGHAPSSATPEAVRALVEEVGDQAEVKAAGGMPRLQNLVEFYRLGARRFGIGAHFTRDIMREIEALPNQSVEV
jgi:deoxyribose-phosphate aldolase